MPLAVIRKRANMASDIVLDATKGSAERQSRSFESKILCAPPSIAFAAAMSISFLLSFESRARWRELALARLAISAAETWEVSIELELTAAPVKQCYRA